MTTILVQMSKPDWTLQALHLACALARTYQANVVLLRLIPVTHPGYLGTTYGNLPPDGRETVEIEEYQTVAEDYRVCLKVESMQYVTALDAVAEAADHLDSIAVFAHIPQTPIQLWQSYCHWSLKRRLKHRNRQLFTLDNDLDLLNEASLMVSTSVQHSLHTR